MRVGITVCTWDSESHEAGSTPAPSANLTDSEMQKYFDCKMPDGGKLRRVLSMLESRLGISYDVKPTSCGVSEQGEVKLAYDITLSRNIQDVDQDESCWYTYYITERGDFGTFSGQSDRSNIVRVSFLNANDVDSGLIRILENERAMGLAFGLPPIKSENQLKMYLDINGK